MKNSKCLLLILFLMCIIILFLIVQIPQHNTFKSMWHKACKKRGLRFASKRFALHKKRFTPIDLVVIWYSPHLLIPPPPEIHTGKENEHYNPRDYDELKYLLRSVTAFAPWINRVHIVVAPPITPISQTAAIPFAVLSAPNVKSKGLPSWLRLQHPQLNVVNVNEIMSTLNSTVASNVNMSLSIPPIFNMHAIEACLHRIPSLSEHYVYAHRGMLFGNVTRVSDFFNEDGTIALFVSPVLKRPVTIQDTVGSTYRKAWLHTYTALESVYGVCKLPTYLPCPQLTMMSVTLGQHAESTFSVALGGSVVHTDKTAPNAKSIGLCTTLHTIGLQLYEGLCVGRVAVASRVPTMQYMDWSSEIDSVNKRRLKLIVKTRPQLLCVNNIDGSPTNVASWYKFAEAYYPIASRFEML